MNIKHFVKKILLKSYMENYQNDTKIINGDILPEVIINHICDIVTPCDIFKLKGTFKGYINNTAELGLTMRIYDSSDHHLYQTHLIASIIPNNSMHLDIIRNLSGEKKSGFATHMMTVLLNMIIDYNSVADADHKIHCVTGSVQPECDPDHVMHFYRSLDKLFSSNHEYYYKLDDKKLRNNRLFLSIEKA